MSGIGLTRKSSLTFISQVGINFARLLAGFVLSPLLVQYLGPFLFGVWNIIFQTISYISLADLRPGTTLKYLLAISQQSVDPKKKRQLIGEAVRMGIVSLPFFLLIGIGLWQLHPYVIEIPEHNYSSVRLAYYIVLGTFVVDRILSIPTNVLAGQNMGFVGSFGVVLSIFVSTGATILALLLGGGIAGVAGGFALGAASRNILQYLSARKAIEWFGKERAPLAVRNHFLRTSLTVLTGSMGWFFLSGMEVLLIGFLASPESAGQYAITSTFAKMVFQLGQQLISSNNVGLSFLCKSDQPARLKRATESLEDFTHMLMAVCGLVAALFSKSFVLLWIGPEMLSSDLDIFLIVSILSIQTAGKIHVALLDGYELIGVRSWNFIVYGVGAVLFAIVGAHFWGTKGILSGLLIGNLFSYIHLNLCTAKYVRRSLLFNCFLLFAIIVIFALCTFVVSIDLDSWLSFVVQLFIATLTISSFYVFACSRKEFRTELVAKLRTICS